MRPYSLFRWLAAAIEISGGSAGLVLARFLRTTYLNRTSRRRVIRRVPQICPPTAVHQTDAPGGGDVVIPVYNNLEDTVALLESLARDNTLPGRIIIVHDCSTDRRVGAMLKEFAATNKKATLIENDRNCGFVKTCNRGMAESGRDLVILNTDIDLPKGAIARLIRCLHIYKDAATATPFSNSAYGVGVPDLVYANPPVFGASTTDIDLAFNSLRAVVPVELPSGVGFCMAISHAALIRFGGFDIRFGQGYGEETDFCRRAAKAGMRNILAADVFVAHKGGRSFGSDWQDKSRRGLLKVLSLHPELPDRVSQYLQQGETRAISFAALVQLAERLSGQGLEVRNENGGVASAARSHPGPALKITQEAQLWKAELSFANEIYAFSFASRALIDEALALRSDNNNGASD